MNVLVTGGAGFIGTNYIYYHQEVRPEDKIVCLDLLTYAGNLKNLEAAQKHSRFEFVRGDIADEVCVDKLFACENFDLVINFAAETHVDRSVGNPGAFLRTNTTGTQVLLDACRKYNVSRFHQVSTDEVYGDLPLDRLDLKFTEETRIHASSPYSASKAGADLLVLAYHRTYGLPVTISRCSNNYGPYQFPEKLIPLMISRAVNDEPLPVYGNGKNVRDWLYVTDHAAAVEMIARNGRSGEVYNVGGGFELANIKVVKTILRHLEKPESLIKYVTDRPGHDLRYAIDSTKLSRELGWSPTLTFAKGMEQTIKWYIDNRRWWEEILSGEYRSYFADMYKGRVV